MWQRGSPHIRIVTRKYKEKIKWSYADVISHTNGISAIGDTEDCEAYILADRYMSKYYPGWYERYPVKLADPETYFTFEGENADRFIWDTNESANGLKDPENIREKAPEDVLELLFAEGEQDLSSGQDENTTEKIRISARLMIAFDPRFVLECEMN